MAKNTFADNQKSEDWLRFLEPLLIVQAAEFINIHSVMAHFLSGVVSSSQHPCSSLCFVNVKFDMPPFKNGVIDSIDIFAHDRNANPRSVVLYEALSHCTSSMQIVS